MRIAVAVRAGQRQAVDILGGRETRIRDARCEAPAVGPAFARRASMWPGGRDRRGRDAVRAEPGPGLRRQPTQRRTRTRRRCGDEHDGLRMAPPKSGCRSSNRRDAMRRAARVGPCAAGIALTSGWRSRRCGPNGIRTACGASRRPAIRTWPRRRAAPAEGRGRAGPTVLQLGHHARWAAARGQDEGIPEGEGGEQSRRAGGRGAPPVCAVAVRGAGRVRVQRGVDALGRNPRAGGDNAVRPLALTDLRAPGRTMPYGPLALTVPAPRTGRHDAVRALGPDGALWAGGRDGGWSPRAGPGSLPAMRRTPQPGSRGTACRHLRRCGGYAW